MDDVLKKVISLLYGCSNENICRICFKDLTSMHEADVKSSHDRIILKTEYETTNVSLHEILEHLSSLKVDAEELPNIFCQKCANKMIELYTFKLKCSYQESELQKLIYNLNASNFENKKKVNQDPDRPIFYLYSDVSEILIKKQAENVNLLSDQINTKEVKSKPLYKTQKNLNIDCNKRKECVECHKKFKSVISIKSHTKKDYCFRCNIVFECKTKFKSHMKEVHKNKYVCQQCGKSMSTNTLLKIHEDSHKDKICEQCGAIYKTSKSLKIHIANCKQLAALRDFKRNHITPYPQKHKLYGISQKYVCDYCQTEYQQKYSLTYHIKKHHLNPGTYKCNICNRSFNQSRNLNTHLKTHTHEKTEQCTQCLRYFVTKMALKYHMRLHSGEKPYQCTICSDRFLSSSRRMQHMRTKHWGPQLSCNICNKKYYTPYELKKHFSRHSNPNSRLYYKSDGQLVIENDKILTSI